MAITLRSTRLVSLTAIEQAEDEFNMWAAEYLGEQAIIDAAEFGVYAGSGAYESIQLAEYLEEHSPTLSHEAIAFEAQLQRVLGYDPRATAEIPTVKLAVDPETIELEALPSAEWEMHRACSVAYLYNRTDLF